MNELQYIHKELHHMRHMFETHYEILGKNPLDSIIYELWGICTRKNVFDFPKA